MPDRPPDPAPHDPYAALRVGTYRDYLGGSFLALLGRQAVTAVATWQVYQWTHSATALGLVGFVNVLVAKKVPVRNGKPLGATEFTNTQAAYDDLPADVKTKLANATATHDWNNFHELMRRKGSTRPALTEAQRRERLPVSHPVFLTHPSAGGRSFT